MKKRVINYISLFFISLVILLFLSLSFNWFITGYSTFSDNSAEFYNEYWENDDNGKLSAREYFADLPWVWILITSFTFIILLIIGISVLMFIKNNSENSSVVFARKPSFIPKPQVVAESVPIVVQSVPVSQPKKQIKEKEVLSPKEKLEPEIKPVVNSQLKSVAKSTPVPIFDVTSIKDHVESQSTNSKVRIRYFLESGYMFLEKKDYEVSKHIYRFIFAEYKKLEFHDEKLYRDIMSFRLGIP